jgi:hypothetical protein
MKTYARIQDNTVVELFSTDGDISSMFHPALIWVDVTAEAVAPKEGWSYKDGEFSAAPAPSNDLLWKQFQMTAQIAINESDLTILRCYERSVPVPAEWSSYRTALRVILGSKSGDPSISLPSKPAYPSGT